MVPVQLRDDLSHYLGGTSGCWDDILGSPVAIVPQLSGGVIHGLLGGSDGMHCGREFFTMAKLSWTTLARVNKQLVVQEAYLKIVRELP